MNIKLSLRTSVFAVVVVMAIVPVLLLSVFFVDRIYDLKHSAVQTELEMSANALTTQMSHELDVMLARLQTMSSISDVVLTTHSPLFGHRAVLHMQHFLENNPLVSSIYLLDAKSQTLEVSPTSANLIPLPEKVTQYSQDLFQSSNLSASPFLIHRLDNKAFILQTIKLIEVGMHNNSIRYFSNAGFVIVLPLYMYIGKSQVEKELKGTMVAIVPQYRIAQRLKALSGEQTQFDFYVNDKATLKGVERESDHFIEQSSNLLLPDGSTALSVHFYELKQKYYQPVQDVLFKLSMLVLLALLFVFVIAYWLARRVSEPLSKLQSELLLYAEGDYQRADAAQCSQFYEVQQIYQVLQQMSMRIIHDHNELEERVKQRTIEVEASNSSLRSMMDKFQQAQEQLIESEKMALLGQLVAGVAHEINTPVGISVTAASYVIDSFKELSAELDAGKLSRNRLAMHMERISSSCQMILTNLQRSSELIRNFKSVAVEQSTDQLRPFALYHYLNEVLNSLHHRLKQLPVKVVLEGDTELQIESYPGVFGQILTNLVLNSVLHAFVEASQSQEGKLPQIWIRFWLDEQQALHLTFKDNGKGVDEATRARLFEPFFTTKRNKGGTGLGLHIVYNLVVQKLHGTIQCDSEKGQYMMFEICMPVALATESST